MALPIRTTIADIEGVCAYLATKPTGATVTEAKAVLDSSLLDGRKLSALRYWSLVEDNNGKLRLTEKGRALSKDKCARRASVLTTVIGQIPPYAAIVERGVHKNELTIAATDVAAHWHQHFKSEASDNDKILNDQAVCFFQLAEGADLGQLIVGRKGQPTRFEFDEVAARSFVENDVSQPFVRANSVADESHDTAPIPEPIPAKLEVPGGDAHISKGNRVFITHGKNRTILDQVKELVAFGKFEPIVAQERETSAKPVPEKVMEEMRSCQAAVIHVGVEGVLYDKDKNEVPQLNGNVLIEVGAAMALYGKNFILLVEEGAKLPSNLQGLYECRYSGNELSMGATMKLLKAFNAFR
jgi:hypothetical protein